MSAMTAKCFGGSWLPPDIEVVGDKSEKATRSRFETELRTDPPFSLPNKPREGEIALTTLNQANSPNP